MNEFTDNIYQIIPTQNHNLKNHSIHTITVKSMGTNIITRMERLDNTWGWPNFKVFNTKPKKGESLSLNEYLDNIDQKDLFG